MDVLTRKIAQNPEAVYEISMRSAVARSGEVYIYELSDLNAFLDSEQAEDVRRRFLEQSTSVKQISNSPSIPEFSKNREFINKCLEFRYVPAELYRIRDEVLMFDDVVAIYNDYEITVIEDRNFADSQRELFLNLWGDGINPSLEFDYKPNHSFYNSIDFMIDEVQVIVWPDAEAKNAYSDYKTKEALGEYLKEVLTMEGLVSDTSYLICFIWALEGEKMVDVWRFNHNYVDDRSGPLSDVTVLREGKPTSDLGLASGNTLLVLGHEEKLRRQSVSLKGYLDGQPPKLPLEVMNGMEFFAD